MPLQRHHAGGHHPGLCPCLPCLDVCPGSSVLVPSIHGQAPLSGISRPVFQFVVVCLPQNSAPGGQGCQPGAQCSNRLGVPQQPKGSLLFGRVPALPRPGPPPSPAPLPPPAPVPPPSWPRHFLSTAPSPVTFLSWLLPAPFSSSSGALQPLLTLPGRGLA